MSGEKEDFKVIFGRLTERQSPFRLEYTYDGVSFIISFGLRNLLRYDNLNDAYSNMYQ